MVYQEVKFTKYSETVISKRILKEQFSSFLLNFQ